MVILTEISKDWSMAGKKAESLVPQKGFVLACLKDH